MRSLRRLAVVSVAPLSAVLLLSFQSARAQSVATPSNQSVVRVHPAPFAVQVSPSQFTAQTPTPQTIPSAHVFVQIDPGRTQALNHPDSQTFVLHAENEPTCFAMRTYAYTTPQDSASAPRLSGYTTCTPSKRAHIKELVKGSSSH